MNTLTLTITSLLWMICVITTAQWSWQSPYPVANDLKEVFCINNDEGWVVGELGTILKTTDGGLTFHKMECPVQVNLNSVEYFNADLGFCAGDNGTLMIADLDGTHWSVVETATSADLMDICLIQPDNGWVVGKEGTILHSGNGGDSWELQCNDTTLHMNSVFFLDAQKGWAAGRNEEFEGIVLRTTNGGGSWTEICQVALPEFSVIFMINENKGWAVMNDGTVYSTVNGGIAWAYQLPQLPGTIIFKDIIFKGTDQGWLVGVSLWTPVMNSIILHTADGGITWEPQEDYSWNGFNGVYFTDANHGCAVGNIGSVTCTPNGGNPWVVLAGDYTHPPLYDIHFTSGENGWAAGGMEYPYDSRLFHTTDGGTTWEDMQVADNIIRSIWFINAFNGWIAGGPSLSNNSAIIRHTNDGGLSWETQLELATWHSFRDVCFTGPNKGWAVGGSVNVNPPQGSLLYHTSNGGDLWEEMSGITDKCLASVSFASYNHGWIAGHETILGTTNGGENWEEIWSGVHSWKEICFVDPNNGWVLGDSTAGNEVCDVLMSTSDGGETWQKQFFDLNLSDMVFTGINYGWLVGAHGLILFTNDGGETWQPRFSGTNEDLHAVTFWGQEEGWVAGNHSAILHTSTGGLSDLYSKAQPGKIDGLFGSPNPFTSQTTIEFSVQQAGWVSMDIFSLDGQYRENILLKEMPAGKHSIVWHPELEEKGIFLVRLLTNRGMAIVKLVKS